MHADTSCRCEGGRVVGGKREGERERGREEVNLGRVDVWEGVAVEKRRLRDLRVERREEQRIHAAGEWGRSKKENGGGGGGWKDGRRVRGRVGREQGGRKGRRKVSVASHRG
eukprot:1130698-Rhodomonas_salina.4